MLIDSGNRPVLRFPHGSDSLFQAPMPCDIHSRQEIL